MTTCAIRPMCHAHYPAATASPFFYRMFTQPNLCVYTTTHDIARYPVLRNAVSFGGRSANKEDWNRFVMALKTSGSEDLQDVMKFLAAWCGATESSGSYSF
jgi:hypothetical protein